MRRRGLGAGGVLGRYDGMGREQEGIEQERFIEGRSTVVGRSRQSEQVRWDVLR